MAKKSLKKTSSKKKSTVGQIADPVVNSARDIWRAGLGAVALAQQEGSKVVGQGAALFDELVKEGAKLEAQGRKAVGNTTTAASKELKSRRDDIDSKLEGARKQAEDRWDKLENIFEDRVVRVMDRLGIPTSEDVTRLNRQVETLTGQIAALVKQEAKAARTLKAKAKTSKPAKTAAKPAKASPKADKPVAVTVFHLLPKDDQWTIRQENRDRDIRVLDTKREALAAARAVAQGDEPSRLVVHRADGTIQDSFSYGDND